MTSPVSDQRHPPAGVPADATWDRARSEWLAGHKDEAGRWHGLVTGYDPAGLVRSRQQFELGVAEGVFTRLHPSGAVAYSATFRGGKLEGEARAVSSHEPHPVPLRSCCVPKGAWALVTHYDQGRWLDDWFENEAGCPLLSDGSPRPMRPATVPEGARYDEANPGWVMSEHSLELQREGSWQRWAPSGELLEELSYQRGKLHGSARTYQAGRLIREREYLAGVLEGPAREHWIEAGVFSDTRIRSWQGSFSGGSPTGRWTYRDASGAVLFDREYGAPCFRVELTHALFAAAAPEQGWPELGRELAALGQPGLALCAWARAAGATGNAQAFREQLLATTVLLAPARSVQALADLRKPQHARPGRSREEEFGLWIQALLDGASPGAVLGHLGTLLLRVPRAGLDFIEAAIALDPTACTFLPAKVMLLLELGQPSRARLEAARLEQGEPCHARWSGDSCRLLFPDFEFWPAQASFELDPNPELPERICQPLEQIRHSIGKCVVRLGILRQALIEAVAVNEGAAALPPDAYPPWLPPDLSALLEGTLPTLERYEFTETSSDDEPEAKPDVVRVNETQLTDGLGITSLMRLVRVEWTCLCWLCWGAGLQEVALPRSLAPPPSFPRALATAFFQLFRVLDSLQTRGIRSKARGLPAAHWEGQNVDTLEPPFPQMAFDEAREVRAVLFWLADDGCRSLWQDDLRDV